VVLASGFPAEYQAIVREAKNRSEFLARETAAFGTNHAEVGACLLGLWGLPAPILDIVRYHHRPGDAPEASRRVVAAVHVADALACDMPGMLDEESLAMAGCSDMVGVWRAMAENIK
jgi:HD-like signal output (HDOD) protein